MSGRFWAVALASLGVACGTGSVRELSKAEQDYMSAVSSRVERHRAAVATLLGDLRTIERQFALAERQNTTTAVAEAKLLESMQEPLKPPAPSKPPSPALDPSQRAVILAHVYELVGQQHALFEAEQAERDAERQKVLDAYDALAKLLGDALEDEKTVLAYANQPKGSQIAGVIAETLTEAHAASASLSSSSDPRLQKLAHETDKVAARLDQNKKSIQDALNALGALKSAKK